MKIKIRDRMSQLDPVKRRQTIIIVSSAAAILLLCLPFMVSSSYLLHIVISISLYCVLALSLNLVTGFAGQLSFGHAAFYGIGAYTGALVMLNLRLPFWLALIVSALVAALFGLLLGLPTLRLRGDYLAIVTLGFGEIVRLVLVNWSSLTRGPKGLPGIPAPVVFGYRFSGRVPYYYLVLSMVVVTVFIVHRITTSGPGMAMMCIKNDEVAAESIGIYPIKIKLMSFMLSAALAGVAGTFYASYISFISPDTFLYNDSVTILAMVVLGGLSSIPGSIVGAVVLSIVPEILRSVSDYRMILYGALMVFMMIYRPEGFWGISHRRKNIYKLQMRGGKIGTEKHTSN